jgi:elongation factor P--(R)-beta-lysine ligase
MDKKNKRISILHDRAQMLAKARDFFAQKQVLEVDCPILSYSADIAVHIDLITARYNQKNCYMHPSPEYGMKRLISEGIGDIYQLSHVFRDNECSHKHNPEFMMVEWYRQGMGFVDLIGETLDFIRLFLKDLPYRFVTYREAFQHYAGLDYVKADKQQLLDYIKQRNIPAYKNIEKEEDKDALLNVILGAVIEPRLGNDELCALAYYPPSQAALAKTSQNGDEKVAERFEIYYKGLELCNGYHELTDPIEQRIRFVEANQQRLKLGKTALPIDENFLKALEKGMPDCCGVAVGFDRLMMLRHQTDKISDVLPFTFE